jgi:hypothetical protein
MAHRHPTLYLSDLGNDDLVVIQVKDQLFRVHRSKLASYSGVFEDLFALPQVPLTTEGKSDDHPIHLSHSPLAEFEELVQAIYEPDSSVHSAQTLVVRMAAATRWDAPAMRSRTLSHLAASGDDVAKLVVARRYNLEEWLWPAFFSICIRAETLTKNEVLDLGPKDSDTITVIREALKEGWQRNPGKYSDRLRSSVKARVTQTSQKAESLFQKEDHLRHLLKTKLQLGEPCSSELPPPTSGYRIRMKHNEEFPFQLVGDPLFRDLNGGAVYLGSALIKDNYGVTAIVPCKIAPRLSSKNSVTWDGREIWVDEFEILPFDPRRMGWVKTSDGKIPDGKTPVEGGYNGLSQEILFHAYGIVDFGDGQITCPGKTSESIGGASLPFGNQENLVKDDYYILVWT